MIAWTTIRQFLVLSLLNGWETRQVDFVLGIIKQHAASRKAGATQAKGKSNKTNPYTWKDVAPRGNDPTTRVFRDKEYMYCPHGHKNKCRLDPVKKDKKQPLKSSMRAMTMVIDDHYEEDETDSEDENI